MKILICMLIINFFVLSSSHSSSVSHVQKSNLLQKFAFKTRSMLETFNKKIEGKGHTLYRYDSEINLEVEAGIGLLGASVGKGAELIWRRNNKDSELENEIALGVDESYNFKQLKSVITKESFFQKLNKKQQRIIINFIDKDSKKITRLLEDFISLKYQAGWKIERFFRIYNFSFDKSFIGTEIDKRIRIRFYVPDVYIAKKPRKRIQKIITRVTNQLNRLASADLPYHQFILNRARSSHAIDQEIDLGVIKIGTGKGFLIEYVKTTDNLAALYSVHTNKKRDFVDNFESINLDTDKHYLSEIRISTELQKRLNLWFFELSKDNSLELHYRRNK